MGEFNVCNNSRLLFTGTDDSLMYEIKTEDMKILATIKKCLSLVIV